MLEPSQEPNDANVAQLHLFEKKKKSFCLSVKCREVDGKSSIPFAYPFKSLQLISENPYSRHRKSFKITEAAVAEFFNSYVAIPKNRFDDTILESHRYGWYSHIRFDIKLDYVALLKSKSTKT